MELSSKNKKQVSFQFVCEHLEHCNNNANVMQCSCSRYVCDACVPQHVTTKQHTKTLTACQCTLHDQTQPAYGNLCDCGFYICDTCTEIHLLKSKFHKA
jgi:hypothetical protein